MFWIIAIILIPIVYFLVSLILILIPINNEEENSNRNKSIYLNSNGVHLSIIIAKNQLNPKLLNGLKYYKNDNYFAFGWGDKNFYPAGIFSNHTSLTSNSHFSIKADLIMIPI